MPGWDQVSHPESGAKARSRTGPLADRISSLVSPSPSAEASTSSSRPSCEATASRCPSGEATSSCTRPSRPAASRRGAEGPAARGSWAISTASSPSASVT